MTSAAKVLVLVEGQSEERFVKDLLAPALAPRGVWLTPTIITTKRTGGASALKGGVSRYAKLRREVLLLCGDSSAAMVTTMVDYYGLPTDVPCVAEASDLHRVDAVERGWAADIAESRFLPNIVQHEFETYVFAAPGAVERELGKATADQVRKVRARYRDVAEDINDGAETSPSRRLVRLLPTYQKATDGVRVCKEAGLATLRHECPRLDRWVARLEALTA